jgi:DNA polymerase-3 subunit epsilon
MDDQFDQTHWTATRRRGPLPTYYYHTHFLEILEFVERHYRLVLRPDDLRLMAEFRSLPKKEQCLYVRLLNRKRLVIMTSRLKYPELGDVTFLLRTLCEHNWLAKPAVYDYAEVLSFLTKAEIYDVLRLLVGGISRSLKKDQLVGLATSSCSPTHFLDKLDTERLLVRMRVDEIGYLLFLYFGRMPDGLKSFAMRDLGLVRNNTTDDRYEPRFGEVDEALENYFFARQLHAIASACDGEISAFARRAQDWPAPNHSNSAALRDELAQLLGRRLEQTGQTAFAQRVYGKGESTECTERLFRILLKDGKRAEAEGFLRACVEKPRSEEEAQVAEDLYARTFTKKRTSSLTDELRSAETVELDEAFTGTPERAAIQHFQQLGLRAFRTENHLWRTFFGLLFWDLLHSSSQAVSHSPFEFVPACLLNGSFAATFQSEIAQRLELTNSPVKLKQRLLKTSSEHYGQANGLFRWRQSMLEPIFTLVDAGSPIAIEKILRQFCTSFSKSRFGYPDLMVVDADGIRFVEVKAEGDQLRRNQFLRQRQLREAGFRADILRIRWVLDPQQTYVVVDVETTGGRGPQHRVTEVGAIKLRGGKVIDRFHTLVNPQRAILPSIARMTGISQPMVENAPLFADVAGDFQHFMSNAIFVAHNVEFDYRVITQEFKRIGKPFRYAKLCTCSSMRKFFPGHDSYSLASLCRRFNISLDQHHRALCDAEAAAELLLMINDKRAEALRN